MLSILIPVFNFDVRPLVADLHRQCQATGVEFEILCFDDGSKEQFKKLNRELDSFPDVTYREMPRNLGRSAIRNALGQAAKYPYLLFMDCDSKVVDDRYIQNYLDHLKPGQLVYGGRVYGAQMPENQHFIFHWKYGTQREVQAPEIRQTNPWHSFMTNNFLVPRDVFLDIQFDESLKQYGHEDTLFGLALAARKIPIQHIDAPLEHIGLEPVEVFLRKTRKGLENLHTLWKQDKAIDTRLLRIFLQTKKWKMGTAIKLLFGLLEKQMEKNLCGRSPSLLVFDLYKLGYLHGL